MRDAQEETITNMCSSLLKIHTSPHIIKTIKIYTQQWMAEKNSPSPICLHPDNKHHQEIIKAIGQQEKIGWTHLIRGKLTHLWKSAQKIYQGNKYSSKWPLLSIKAIIQATQKIWEIQNILKFGTKTQAQSNHQKRLKPTITSYYKTYRQTVPRTQYKLFQVPLQIRLTFSPQENTQWIKTVKLAKKIHKQQVKEFYKSFYPITRYFPPTKKNPNTVKKQKRNQKPEEINDKNNPPKKLK